MIIHCTNFLLTGKPVMEKCLQNYMKNFGFPSAYEMKKSFFYGRKISGFIKKTKPDYSG
jgi:hypothetical protein